MPCSIMGRFRRLLSIGCKAQKKSCICSYLVYSDHRWYRVFRFVLRSIRVMRGGQYLRSSALP